MSDLHSIMCLDYTNRMKLLRKSKICSAPVARCIDHIYDSLHTRITLSDLSALTCLNPSYLSRIFKKETGLTISAYIQHQKIETACNMLSYSDYTPSEISTILAFPSQSYFTAIFRKITGAAPQKYKQSHFRSVSLGSLHRNQ